MSLSTFGNEQTLKSYGSKTINFNSEMSMDTETAAQSKMYKRSLFSIQASLSGINAQFSSCYAPNVFDVSISINAEGITGGNNGSFQMTDYLQPIKSIFSRNVIYNILMPHDILLINYSSSSDEDGATVLLNEHGNVEEYIKKSFNYNTTYRVYFPSITNGGNGNGTGSNSRGSNVVNWSKLYDIAISAQDKNYSLNVTTLT